MTYEEIRKQAKDDCEKAKKLPTPDERWEKNPDEHHPMAVRIANFLGEYDYQVCQDCFCWKFGGDGDNGEQLLYELDAFFEMLENEAKTP